MLKKLLEMVMLYGYVGAIIKMRIPKNMCQYYADLAMYLRVQEECLYECWMCQAPVGSRAATCVECDAWSTHNLKPDLFKWQIAGIAIPVHISDVDFENLKASELSAPCDGKQGTCDLYRPHTGCTVGHCRRVS
jgi:hypothetical protein